MGNKPKSILKKQKAAIPADFEEVAAAAVGPDQVEANADEAESDDGMDDDLDESEEAEDDSFGELTDSDEDESDDEDMIRALQDGGERPAKSKSQTHTRICQLGNLTLTLILISRHRTQAHHPPP